MRALAIAAVLAGCGRIAFDPLGSSGGGVDEENIVERPIISVGKQLSCVRRGDGSVWCWGDGRRWQLGNGGEELPRVNPAPVQGLPGPVVAVDAGFDHVCALTDAGEVWCWGDNGLGQVDGTDGVSNKPPTRVPLPRLATTVSAGSYHSCAILDDQSVSCWGKNSDGQIGKGPLSQDHVLQHDVLDRVTAIATGVYHTCAVRDGLVYCWGLNASGQLGDGTGTRAEMPTSIGITASSVTAGSFHTCALDAGRYRCWGDNGDGQLGIEGDSLYAPAPASALDGFIALRAGGSHTCAVRDDDSVWCWGNNTLGTLGDGTGDGATSRSTSPIQIATPRADIAAGWDHTCAVDSGGVVTCWGAGRFGAVGDPARTAKIRPQELSLPGTVRYIAAGSRFACAVVGASEDLYCWGQNGFGQLAVPEGEAVPTPMTTGLSSVGNLSLGENHGCADIAGTMSCWGGNNRGQLGDGTGTSRSAPMPTATNLAGVESGFDFSCGFLGVDLYCWGANERGKLGGIVGTEVLAPTSNGITGTTVDLGVEHACVRDGTTATCWGWNERGQLGRGTESASEGPGAVSGAISWNALTTGAEHTCGADTSGALYCWGVNVYGMLGLGDGNDRNTPTQIVASAGREITARRYHTCAEINGAARCWGYNECGQVGDGTLEHGYSPSTVVDVPAGVTMFALGDDFTCVLSNDAKVRCWGDNTFGQLGIGVLGFVPSPYTVAF